MSRQEESSSDTADSTRCPHCGKTRQGDGELAQFLARLGITEDMLGNVKSQFANVDIDEYLQTARDYMAGQGTPHRSSSPRRTILFPTDEGTLERRTIEDAIAYATGQK